MKEPSAKAQHFYYDRATKEKIPVSDEVYAVLSGEASRIRMKEQYHRRCMCPKQFIWKCDGCCQDCEYHAAGDVLSLDVPGEDGDSCMYDSIADPSVSMEETIANREIISQIKKRMHELDPDAETIISLWEENDHISDRELARILNKPRATFTNHLRKMRDELREIYGSESF